MMMMGRRGRAGDEKTGVGNRKRKTGNMVLVPRGTFPHIGLRTSTPFSSAVKKRAAKKGGRCRKHRWRRSRHKGWAPSSGETHSERHIISERANVQIAREEVLTGEIESGVSKPEIKVVERELAALENRLCKGVE